jgi:hypothetical protein
MRKPKTDVLDGFCDLEPFAENVNRHPRSVYRWLKQPNGLPYVKLGSRILIPVAAARGWIDSQIHQSNPRRKEKTHEQA